MWNNRATVHLYYANFDRYTSWSLYTIFATTSFTKSCSKNKITTLNQFFCLPVCVRICPCSSHGLEKHFPQYWHLQPWLCVRTCMENAGILTYNLSQWGHLLAFLSPGLRCVCRCLAKLLEVLYLLPQSLHSWSFPSFRQFEIGSSEILWGDTFEAGATDEVIFLL